MASLTNFALDAFNFVVNNGNCLIKIEGDKSNVDGKQRIISSSGWAAAPRLRRLISFGFFVANGESSFFLIHSRVLLYVSVKRRRTRNDFNLSKLVTSGS